MVSFFSNNQKKNIESALNYKPEKSNASIGEAARLFSQKVDILNSRIREQRQNNLEGNRKLIFDNVSILLNRIKQELFELIPVDKAKIRLERILPNDEKYFWYAQQIIEFAKVHDYYFNKLLPRGWFKISFTVAENKRYDLIISIHHFSYEDSVIAVGSFLEFLESHPQNGEDREDKITIPVNLKPFTISLEGDASKHLKNLEQYVRDVINIGLTVIANEIV